MVLPLFLCFLLNPTAQVAFGPGRTLSEGGMSYLVASVRANTGLKSGRYMFEAGRELSMETDPKPPKAVGKYIVI